MGDFITGTSFINKRGVFLKQVYNDTLRTKGVQAPMVQHNKIGLKDNVSLNYLIGND